MTQRKGSTNIPLTKIDKLGEDKYRVTIAVAGFTMDDLNIVLQDGKLMGSGSSKDTARRRILKVSIKKKIRDKIADGKSGTGFFDLIKGYMTSMANDSQPEKPANHT